MSRRGRSARGKQPQRDNGNGWEEWGGYMNAKKQKLQNQLRREDSGSNIFAGVRIHVNGYTKPSSDELKRLMILHGGGYEHYLYRTRVTHVIATNLPDSKVKELKGLKVVSPEWITDSISAGKLLSYSKYLLYSAQSGRQKGLQTYTSRQISNQSEGSLQSINRTSSEITGSCSSEFDTKNRIDEHNVSAEIVDDQNTVSPKTAVGKNNGILPNMSRLNGQSPLKENVNSKAQVISPGKMADARDPKFLNEYYNNSRLHFLSTWKAEWKNYVNKLQSKGDNFPGREKLRRVVLGREVNPDNIDFVRKNGKPQRCVMHIDMDCFFVSVGLRKRPDLRGKPIAVTHSRGKGATVDPESDFAFEKRLREQKKLQRGKKGRKGESNKNMMATDDIDTSFPDQSDSSSDDDVIDDVTLVTKTTTEPFHSMAEIASCSYEARKAGVKNGMFMGRAKAICPELVTIPYDFEGYKAVSKILYDTVASYTHDIEAVSCDEMLIDCTDLLADTGATPLEFATLLRDEIYSKTECPASTGIGSSILLARMATRKAKPDGQFYLTEDQVSDYIKQQPVKDLPGVGWSTTRRFEAMKVTTCGDLQRISLDALKKEFGPKTGQSLYRYCRGQDDRPIKMEQQRKSVSAEVNYGIRFTTDSEAVTFLEELSEEVSNRLKSIGMKGKTVTLKLMVRTKDAPKETAKFMGHGICDNFSKSSSMPMATDDAKIVAKETIGLLRAHKVEAADLRGIGIQVQKLEKAEAGFHSNKKIPSILSYTVNKSSKEQLNRINTSSCTENFGTSESTHLPTTERDIISDKNKSSHNLSSSSTTFMKDTSADLSNSAGKYTLDRRKSANFEERGNSDVQKRKSVDFEEGGRTGLDRRKSIDFGEGDLTPEVDVAVAEVIDLSPTVRFMKDLNRIDDRKMLPAVSRGDDDLLDDLGRRHMADTSLPPLPCLPEIKTPESTKKTYIRSSPALLQTDTIEMDYFPSPSQVDLDVLRELPPEIREQIEKEMTKRKKTRPISTELTVPGCSHWQPEAAEHAGNNEIQNEADKHSHDAIVALPSPSQIDQSCLEALPESMQAELRQAYARQSTAKGGNVSRGGNTLQLKQAQSPSKSPNKRSPAKTSPNFKVPRGRPGKRGRPRGSSKKTLFKDQTKSQQQVTSQTGIQNHHSNIEYIEILEKDDDVIVAREPLQTGPLDIVREAISDRVISVNQSDNVIYGNRVEKVKDCVNLCGAVSLYDVRQLLREWINSTPAPQLEDEEMLEKYLTELITDRNLEQVDLLLKFMFRRINHLHNQDWLFTFKRIFNHTQAVVYELYGSRLMSISL